MFTNDSRIFLVNMGIMGTFPASTAIAANPALAFHKS